MALTAKQEAFAVEVAKGSNATAAYRKAYDAEEMSDAAINVAASRLVHHAKVSLRIAELRAPALAKAELSVERWAEHVAQGAFSAPEDAPKWGDKVACLNLAARHLGLFERDNAQRAENLAIQVVLVK